MGSEMCIRDSLLAAKSCAQWKHLEFHGLVEREGLKGVQTFLEVAGGVGNAGSHEDLIVFVLESVLERHIEVI